MTGSAVTYAAGGNGGVRSNPRTDGAAGTANTGKGGGGGSSADPVSNRASGGVGGSGIVIVRYVAGGAVAATPARYFYRPNAIMRPNQAIKNQESAQ
jgi:hypothetical protein